MTIAPFRKLLLAALVALLSPGAPAADRAGDLPADLDGSAVPQVLTPARLRQAQVDAGASVTVIDREMIAALGARDIPELLRLVPGMMVTRISGPDFAASYHGTSIRDSRRMQVLVDGMSVYEPGLARVLWSSLALPVDDIERIEVTRGPDAAAYGANSFSAVINIITTHPQDTAGNMLRYAAGDGGIEDGGGRLAGHSADADWRLSFQRRSDTGFDRDFFGADYRDDRADNTVTYRAEVRPGDRDRLEFQAGINDGENEEVAETHDVFTRYEQAPVNRVRNVNALGRWTREASPSHESQLQVFGWRTRTENRARACLPPILLSDEMATLYGASPDVALDLLGLAADNPAGIPAFIGGLPTPSLQVMATNAVGRYMAFAGAGYNETCGSFDLGIDESRLDVEWQDTWRVGDALRLVSGASWRRDKAGSATYTGRTWTNDTWRLFGHGEYRLLQYFTLNAGAMLERDGISGTQLSPRAALNWRIADQQSVRLVSSRAFRTQDIYEEYADIHLAFRGLAPAWLPDGSTARYFFVSQHSPGNLMPEEIQSREIGWFGYFPAARTELDLRWFREELGRLVSDPANIFDFSANNDSWTTLEGIEGQARYRWQPGSWLWTSFAYIDNDSTHRIEKKFTALQSGSVAVSHRFPGDLQASLACFVNRFQNRSGTTWSQSERYDARLAHDIALGGATTLQVSVNMQFDPDGRPEIYIDNNAAGRFTGWLGARVSW